MSDQTISAGLPPQQGLYDPRLERDACGIGFVANIKGRKSHEIIIKGIEILVNLAHRGACGCDPQTGDGAGVLIQVPHAFFARECSKLGFTLPAPGEYGVGMVFLPVERHDRLHTEGILERIVREEGLSVLGWRDTPIDADAIGRIARASQPYIQQIFIGRAPGMSPEELERKLYVVRKRAETEIANSDLKEKGFFYLPSLSAKTIVYKGLLLAPQIARFYKDLSDPETASALCLVHQRFSTNTFPTWQLAHPFRYICHNGEINTLRGNVNWMYARQKVLASELFGDDVKKLFPIITPGGSDSAMFDNAAELLHLAGRSLPHALAMLIPEAWDADTTMRPEKRAFYEYHASLMEPWDGPAAMAFTDGRVIGATLDRNGLRPGALAGDHRRSADHGLRDGRAADCARNDSRQGPLAAGQDAAGGSGRRPHRPRRGDQGTALEPAALRRVAEGEPGHHRDAARADPLAPDRSRHDSTAAARCSATPTRICGSSCRRWRPTARNRWARWARIRRWRAFRTGRSRCFTYFKQLFAQVTNPPIDPIREELVMSLTSYIGTERNILDETPQHCHTLKLPHPILTNYDLEKLRRVSWGEFLATTLPTVYRVDGGEKELERYLEGLCRRASLAIRDGYTLLILSDRGIEPGFAAIPSLLALSAVHHHLIREGTRTQVALIVESGEPREVMHFCLLIGFGASAINPYLAIETLEHMCQTGLLDISFEAALQNYLKAVNKGLLKVFSKMGISTLQSYRGAQVFEAIGLNKQLVDKYFTGTASRIEGVGLDVLAAEAKLKHDFAYRPITDSDMDLDPGGNYQYRASGEYHLVNAQTISKLQHAVRQQSHATFQEFSDLIDNQNRQLCTLRGLIELKKGKHPVPLEEVEPSSEIVKRFATGAMSFGSISKEAHETLARAMNRIGGRSNTGEGGEDEERFGDRPAQRRQAGGLRPLRRHHQLPGERRRVADQDRAGRQARRGRTAPGAQSGRGDRAGSPLDAGRAVDLAPAAPRHLLDRGSGAAHLRPEERQSQGAHFGEAGGRSRRGNGGGGRGQGACRRHPHQRRLGRHGRVPADLHQARGHSVGTRPGGDPAGAGHERPAQPGPLADRRQAVYRDATWPLPRCWGPRSSASPPCRSSPWAAS